MNLIVTSEQVRDYLQLESPGSTSSYSDDTIGSNIRSAQRFLEKATSRFLFDHPAVTWATTTMQRAQVALPGFRTITTATWGGTLLDVAVPGDGNDSPSAWGLWDENEGEDGSNLIIALQFRPWRVQGGAPWWYVDSQWWDKGLDNPFYPGNLGGAYAASSMPNDLVIVGDGGYEAGQEPFDLRHAVKILAAFYTKRPDSVLSGVSVSPEGVAMVYRELPMEVRDFIGSWRIGEQVVQV